MGRPWIVWVRITGSDGVMDNAFDNVSRYSALHLPGDEEGKTRCGASIPRPGDTWGPLIRGDEAWKLRNTPFRGRTSRLNPTGQRFLKVCTKCDPTARRAPVFARARRK